MALPLSERAAGRWTGILPQLGVAPSYLSGKHGPCPICRGGKDRYRFDDRDGRGTWICSVCGAGDGIALIMAVNGWDFPEAARQIEKLIGSTPKAAARPVCSEDAARAMLRRLWASSGPVQPGDPVSLWLHRRVGLVTVPSCLRTVGRTLYKGEDGEPSSWYPTMVALMSAVDGSPATLHRTFLTPEGAKAPVLAPRRLMPGAMPKGGAVRLLQHCGTLGIAEGIETALAAANLFGVPCWAALTSGMLAAWDPPDDVTEVVVFGDSDPGFAGQAAAYALARRLASRVSVRVEIPDRFGDWNDILLAQSVAPDVQVGFRRGEREVA